MANDSFGDRLRAERVDRNLTIAGLAETLRVDPSVLEALERNDFGSLPSEATMAECLDGYAECLEVDADLMIEDYESERAQWSVASAAVLPGGLSAEENATAGSVVEETETPVAETAAVFQSQSAEKPRSFLWPIGLGLAAIAAIAAFAGWGLLGRGERSPEPRVLSSQVSSSPEVAADTRPTESVEAAEPVELAEPVEPVMAVPAAPQEELPIEVSAAEDSAPEESPAARSAPRERPSPPPVPEARTPSVVRITEFGVGSGVENRRLVGRGDRFSEGTRVYFWTRVLSGRGQSIHHVWLREGVEENRLLLRIGGSNWRTHSTKRLPAGSAGSWVVEARDEAGIVLARAEFQSVP